jgi:NitT/TauT family transport system substrate-binding protein
VSKRVRLVVGAAVLALTAAACGGGDGKERAGSGGLAKVTVGVIPTLDVAPVYLGAKTGIFKKHGIDLEIKQGAGGAAITAAVMSQEYDFGLSNVVSMAIARDKGLGIAIVAPGSASTGDPKADYGAVLVPANSTVDNILDLQGKRVGTNALLNANDTLIRNAVDTAGGDSSKVNFVEIAFADQPAALENGQVDAVFSPEPFMTMAKDAGAKPIFSLYAEHIKNYPASVYFAPDRLIKSDPDLVNRFSAAMSESNSYASAHLDEARKIVLSYTKMSQGMVDRVTMPKWPAQVDRAAVGTLVQLSARYKVIKNANLTGLIR